MRRLKVFTWHVHGSYLYYLSHVPHDFYLPVTPARTHSYCGREASFPWPENVHEIHADAVKSTNFDLILHQSHQDWLVDRFDLLSEEQRRLPRIVIEHGPPHQSPTDSRHPVDDPGAFLVHVSGFNFMRELLQDPLRAKELGRGARRTAQERFHIERFKKDWMEAFALVTDTPIQMSRRHRQRPPRTAARVALISAPMRSSMGSTEGSGDADVYIRQVARHLSRVGYRVDVFACCGQDDPSGPTQWHDDVRLINVPIGFGKSVKKEDYLSYAHELTEFISEFRVREGIDYDVVHIDTFLTAFAAAELKKRFDWPFVVTFHEMGRVHRHDLNEDDRFEAEGAADHVNEERLMIEDRAIFEANRLIVESSQDFGYLTRLYHANPGRVAVIPFGYDPDELWPIDKRTARFFLGLDPDIPLCLHVGSMESWKGIEFSIRGFASARRRRDVQARLLVVEGEMNTLQSAEPAELTRLLNLVREEGIEDRVIFVGRRSRSTLKYYYSAADVFLATPWSDPPGLVCLEAMACGTPVIGTRVGRHSHSIADGETGYLVERDDIGQLEHWIAKLIGDQELREAMSRRATEWARKHSRWSVVANEIARTYDEVIRDARVAHLAVAALSEAASARARTSGRSN